MPTPPLTPPEKLPSGVTPAPPAPKPQPRPLQPRPLQSRTPNIVVPTPEPEPAPVVKAQAQTESAVETEYAANEVASPTPAGTQYAPTNIPQPKYATGPKRKCPACLYFPMLPLAEFTDNDIEKTYRGQGEYYYQTRPFYHIIPMFGIPARIIGFLGNLLFASASDSKKRAKAHRAKAEILSRCPNSLICPECCEVLEIY